MNQDRLAGGWDCQEVQSASRVSPIWYFSLIPVIRGFSSGKSEQESEVRGAVRGRGSESELTNNLHVSWLDESEEGGVSNHLTAVTTRVVEVHVPEEQSATIRQEALAIFYFLL